MNILAIDTAAGQCDACIYDTETGTVTGEGHLALVKGHAEHLMGVIAATMAEAGVGYPDLGAIAVTIGPGSFTGVRVGVSAARGFALALAIPAIGVSTLEGLAAEALADFPGVPVLAAIDARRGELYFQRFNPDGVPGDEPSVAAASQIADSIGESDVVLTGSGAGILAGSFKRRVTIAGERASPGVATIARLAANKTPPFLKPKPLYLRAPDAKVQSGFAVARSTG